MHKRGISVNALSKKYSSQSLLKLSILKRYLRKNYNFLLWRKHLTLFKA
ncbi:hypothetical protein [Candidatus Coxiella mudrowiae]